MRMRAIFGTKTIHLSWTKTFCYKLVRIQNYDDVPFLGPLWSICPIFFIFFFWGGGNYYYHSHLPISPFHCAKLRAQDGPFPQIRFFFRKPVNEPCFFYSCLSTCQKSKSDINLLVKYWWLKNTEISLAESHFCL